MARNKNTPGTGDRGDVPESLVGKIMKAEREATEAKAEAAAVRKELGELKRAKPAPAPEAVAPPPPPPAPEPKAEPKPVKKSFWKNR